MKKKTIMVALLCATLLACSCSNEDEFINESTRTEQSIPAPTDDVVRCELINIGWNIYEMFTKTPDLHLTDDICDRLEEDPHDVRTIIEMVNYLARQDIFADTIGESDAWEFWCEWITYYYKED